MELTSPELPSANSREELEDTYPGSRCPRGTTCRHVLSSLPEVPSGSDPCCQDLLTGRSSPLRLTPPYYPWFLRFSPKGTSCTAICVSKSASGDPDLTQRFVVVVFLIDAPLCIATHGISLRSTQASGLSNTQGTLNPMPVSRRTSELQPFLYFRSLQLTELI